MKKYLTILFIFLAGFIFAGSSASCGTTVPAAVVKIQQETEISTKTAFLQFENVCILRETNMREINENDRQPIFPAISFANNKNLILNNYSTETLQENNSGKFREIKFKIHPRAP